MRRWWWDGLLMMWYTTTWPLSSLSEGAGEIATPDAHQTGAKLKHGEGRRWCSSHRWHLHALLCFHRTIASQLRAPTVLVWFWLELIKRRAPNLHKDGSTILTVSLLCWLYNVDGCVCADDYMLCFDRVEWLSWIVVFSSSDGAAWSNVVICLLEEQFLFCGGSLKKLYRC